MDNKTNGQNERERTYAEAQRAAQNAECIKKLNRGIRDIEKDLGGEDSVPLDTSGDIDFNALENLEAFRKSSNKTKPKSKSRGFEIGD